MYRWTLKAADEPLELQSIFYLFHKFFVDFRDFIFVDVFS